jgi:hypothetical protein
MCEIINEYAKTRRRIHSWLDSKKIPSNDNIVGRIGEYYAIDYFKQQFPDLSIIPASTTNQADYDFCIGSEKYSVKTITKENKAGSTTPIKFNENWNYLVAIKLDDNFNLASLSVIDYPSLKKALDANSLKQGRVPGIKKSFRWWKILNEHIYRKV